MNDLMKQSHLEIAKQLIEIKYKVKVVSIAFEDGTGRGFVVTTKDNPIKKRYVKLA